VTSTSDRSDPSGPAIPRRAIHPSARQAIDTAIVHLGLGRRSFVGVHDFASHCVLDFVSRHATPVPLRFLPREDAAAVLLYDQWGWEKPTRASRAVKDRFPDVTILWDRVDSLPESLEDAARSGEAGAQVQIFSLSKTLGAAGGGLAWMAGSGWLPAPEPEDTALVSAVVDLMDVGASTRSTQLLDGFLRNECDAPSIALAQWLDSIDLAAVVASEHAERKRRLEIFARHADLPAWMHDALHPSAPAPGLAPVRAQSPVESARAIDAEFGIQVAAYHFDFSGSYLDPRWEAVLAVPLHSEVPLDVFERLIANVS
jgi:hypothetical protein